MIKTIGFVCYPATDLQKARDFYEGVLGLKLSRTLSEMWLEYDLGDSTFCVVNAPQDKLPEYYRGPGKNLAFEVESLDDTQKQLEEKGVKTLAGPNDFPTCRSLVLEDPDQNVITLHELKANHAH